MEQPKSFGQQDFNVQHALQASQVTFLSLNISLIEVSTCYFGVKQMFQQLAHSLKLTGLMVL